MCSNALPLLLLLQLPPLPPPTPLLPPPPSPLGWPPTTTEAPRGLLGVPPSWAQRPPRPRTPLQTWQCCRPRLAVDGSIGYRGAVSSSSGVRHRRLDNFEQHVSLSMMQMVSLVWMFNNPFVIQKSCHGKKTWKHAVSDGLHICICGIQNTGLA